MITRDPSRVEVATAPPELHQHQELKTAIPRALAEIEPVVQGKTTATFRLQIAFCRHDVYQAAKNFSKQDCAWHRFNHHGSSGCWSSRSALEPELWRECFFSVAKNELLGTEMLRQPFLWRASLSSSDFDGVSSTRSPTSAFYRSSSAFSTTLLSFLKVTNIVPTRCLFKSTYSLQHQVSFSCF